MNSPIHHAAALQYLAFDHRASIVGYLNDQANAFEVAGEKQVAVTLRAQASNIAIQMDIRAGAQGIASPVDAIILEVCAAFGGTNHSEVVAMNERRATAARVRSAALWVVKKRLPNWTDDQIATAFHAKDRSTVSKGIQRAEQNRAEDNEFKRLTDNLLAQPPLRCENCQHALEPA